MTDKELIELCEWQIKMFNRIIIPESLELIKRFKEMCSPVVECGHKWEEIDNNRKQCLICEQVEAIK